MGAELTTAPHLHSPTKCQTLSQALYVQILAHFSSPSLPFPSLHSAPLRNVSGEAFRKSSPGQEMDKVGPDLCGFFWSEGTCRLQSTCPVTPYATSEVDGCLEVAPSGLGEHPATYLHSPW